MQWSILCPKLYLPAALGITDHFCLPEILSFLGLQKPIAPLFPPMSLVTHSQSGPSSSKHQMLTCPRGWSGPFSTVSPGAPDPVPCFKYHLDAGITKFNFPALTSFLSFRVIHQIASLTYPHRCHIDMSNLIWLQEEINSTREPCACKILSHLFYVTDNYYSLSIAILEVLHIPLRMWSSSLNTTHS